MKPGRPKGSKNLVIKVDPKKAEASKTSKKVKLPKASKKVAKAKISKFNKKSKNAKIEVVKVKVEVPSTTLTNVPEKDIKDAIIIEETKKVDEPLKVEETKTDEPIKTDESVKVEETKTEEIKVETKTEETTTKTTVEATVETKVETKVEEPKVSIWTKLNPFKKKESKDKPAEPKQEKKKLSKDEKKKEKDEKKAKQKHDKMLEILNKLKSSYGCDIIADPKNSEIYVDIFHSVRYTVYNQIEKLDRANIKFAALEKEFQNNLDKTAGWSMVTVNVAVTDKEISDLKPQSDRFQNYGIIKRELKTKEKKEDKK